MSLPVPDKLVKSVNLDNLLTLLDCICEVTRLDPACDSRVRAAEARVEEIIGAYLTRPGTRGAVLAPAKKFETAEAAYLAAIPALTLAFGWKLDTRGGPGYNAWNDLSQVFHSGYLRCHHAAR